MGGCSGRCSAAAGPLLLLCCLEVYRGTVFYKRLAWREQCIRQNPLGKVVGMTRGNQRDLAREKNLKKQQVQLLAACTANDWRCVMGHRAIVREKFHFAE